MMNYEMFKEEVLEKVSSLVEDTKEVKINEVVKNNDLVLDGLVIYEKGQTCSVSPTFYLNPLFDEYSNGTSIEVIIDKMMSIYNNAEPPEFVKKAKQFEDYDFVKKHLYFKVVNYDTNKKMLEDIPHFKTLDLAIIFACLLDKDNDATASITIKNEHLNHWGIDKNQLYEDAFKNAIEMLPPKIYSLFKTVVTREINSELDFNNIQLDDMDLLILTNETKVNGAGTMLYPNLLETIANQLDSDLIIIPSSTHEVLILRKDGNLKLEDLDFLVNMVNHEELATTEVLSTHVYVYLKDEKELTMSQNKEKEMQKMNAYELSFHNGIQYSDITLIPANSMNDAVDKFLKRLNLNARAKRVSVKDIDKHCPYISIWKSGTQSDKYALHHGSYGRRYCYLVEDNE